MSAEPTAPDARFVTLIKRAAFELRLAGDIARTGGYEPQLRALVEGARGNLLRVLSFAAGGPESGVRSQELDDDGR